MLSYGYGKIIFMIPYERPVGQHGIHNFQNYSTVAEMVLNYHLNGGTRIQTSVPQNNSSAT